VPNPADHFKKMARGCSLAGGSRSFEIREHEQNAKEQVRGGEDQVEAARASLQDQNDNSDAVAEFFKHRRQHQRPIARGIGGDEKKRELPGRARPTKP